MGVSSKKVKTTTTPTVSQPMGGMYFGTPGTPEIPASPYIPASKYGPAIPANPGSPAVPGTPGFSQKITDFGNLDPHQFVAPASQLQQQAFANAQNMGGWQPYMQNAMNLAQQAGAAPASQTSAQGYSPVQLGQAPQAVGARLGAAPGMEAAQTGQASEFGGAQLDPAAMAQAAQLAQAREAQAAGIDPTVNAQAYGADWNSILAGGGIGQYMNPATEAYVNTTLSGYDQKAAEQRNAMRMQQAGAGAFGGSRAGIQTGQFDAGTLSGRASTESGLRMQAFQDASNLALSEAARRQQLGQFNAGQQQQVSMSNAAQENARRMQMGQFGQQANMYNADIANQFARQQGDYSQQANMANQAAQNQFALQRGEYGQQAGMANMAARNQFMQSAADRQQAANAANQQMQGQYGLAQAGYDQSTGQFNAGLASQYGLAQYGAGNEAARYGADAQNQANYQNAQLQEQAYQRQLAGAGQYGQLASQYGGELRNDLTLQGQLGDQQREIQRAYLNAIPTQLQMQGQLYGMIPPEAYIGQTGTQNTGGLGSWLPGVVGAIAQGTASAAGGGGF